MRVWQTAPAGTYTEQMVVLNRMDFVEELTIREFYNEIEPLCSSINGDTETLIRGLNVVQQVREGDVTFADDRQYLERALGKQATAVITTPALAEDSKGKCVVILAPEPFMAFREACRSLSGPQSFRTLNARERAEYASFDICVAGSAIVDPRAVLAEGCQIGPDTIVGPGVYVGAKVQVGANCFLHPNVVLEGGVRLGQRVTVGAGSILGSRPNAYKRIGDSYVSYVAVGYVTVGDDVEIGALCTIDRCLTDATVVGSGCRIGNGVQIGHGVRLDAGVLLVAHSAIAGHTHVGEAAVIRGQSGVDHDLCIGRRAVIDARSGVTKSVPDDGNVMGNYAEPKRKYLTKQAALKFLPDLRRDLADIIRERRKQSESWELFREVVARELSLDKADVVEDRRLGTDLRADSLDLVEVQMQLEVEFDLSSESLEGIAAMTVGDAFKLIKELSHGEQTCKDL